MHPPPTLPSLPPELLIMIAAYLSAKDMARLAQTCQALRVMSEPWMMATALSRHRTDGNIPSLLAERYENLDLIVLLLEKFGPDADVTPKGLLRCSNLQFAINVAAKHCRTDLLGAWFERYKQHAQYFEDAIYHAADAGNIDFYEFCRAKFNAGISDWTMSQMISRAARANQLAFIRHVQRDSLNNANSLDLRDAIQTASYADHFDLAIALLDDLETMSDDNASSALQSALKVFLCCAIENDRLEIVSEFIDRVTLTPDNQARLYEYAFSRQHLDAARIIDRSTIQSADTCLVLATAARIGAMHGIAYVLATRSIDPEFVDDALVIAARADKRSVVEMLYPLVTDSLSLLKAALRFKDANLFVPMARAFWSHNQMSAAEVTDLLLEYFSVIDDGSYYRFDDEDDENYGLWFGAGLWLASMDAKVLDRFVNECAANSYGVVILDVLPELLEKTKDAEHAASHQRLSELFASFPQ